MSLERILSYWETSHHRLQAQAQEDCSKRFH